MKRNRSSRTRGFTLIEVLLVLVILVMLASLTVLALGPIQKQAKMNTAKTQIEALSQALQKYSLDCGNPPSATTGLEALRERPGDLPDPSKWAGPYLNKDLTADPWGHPYQYVCPSTHNNADGFDVWTTGPDGQDIGNWTETKK